MNGLFLKQPMMNKVLYALIPVTVFAVFLFGLRVLAVVAVANLAAFITEWLFARKKKPGKVSMAVFVSGTLLGLVVPPAMPLWMTAVGAIVAIAFGKMVFGGFGANIFNPAIVGRTFIYVAFPNYMTVTWQTPFTSWPGGFTKWLAGAMPVSAATPMSDLAQATGIDRLFLGLIPGCIGETSALLIALAGIYLIATKTARWQPIIGTLGGAVLAGLAFYPGQNPLYWLFSGGLMFGAVFMSTDPISMSRGKVSIWVYGLLIGGLTVFIRRFSLFAEGFMFALLLVNTFMPLVEYGLKKINKKY